jgi:hypothetical protein
VAQAEIEIGVPAFRDPDEVTLPHLLEMPFVEQRPTWLLPDGRTPRRDRARPDLPRLVK